MVSPVFEGGAKGVSIPFTQYLQAPKFDRVVIDKTVNLPRGKHSVITGPLRELEEPQTYDIPILSELPFVGDEFTVRWVSPTRVQTFLIVSAKVADTVPTAPAPRAIPQ